MQNTFFFFLYYPKEISDQANYTCLLHYNLNEISDYAGYTVLLDYH